MLALLIPGLRMGASDSGAPAVGVAGQLPLTGVGR